MIYHYTDLNAATSITEKSEVWLTDYRFLNDKEEFSEGYKVLCEALDNYDDYTKEHPQEFKQCIQSAVEYVKRDNFSKFQRDNIFVSSFSRSPDLLSQWRSYGMYCLEFDECFFKETDVYVLDCHYLQDDGDALEYADIIISENIIPELFKIWSSNKEYLVDLVLSSLVDIYALSFKHKSFIDEDEIRFVMSCEPDNDRIQFRARGDILIPYVSVGFEPQILKSITVGPLNNQDLACNSLDMFARKINRKINQYDIEYALVVESSDIPYRSV